MWKRNNSPAQPERPEINIDQALDRSHPTPGWILAHLAQNTDVMIRYRAASHPNCPAEVLDQLAREDESARVLIAVAEHPNACQSTIEHLSYSDDPMVTRSACYFSVWAKAGVSFIHA